MRREGRLHGRQLFSGWSLRRRLVVELVGMLALVCVFIGLATGLALRAFLIQQIDLQLEAAVGRSAAAFGQPPDQQDRPPQGSPAGQLGFLLAPGQAVGTLGAIVSDGEVTQAAILTGVGRGAGISSAGISSSDRALLARLPISAGPVTRSLGTLGDYRLIAIPRPDGEVLVTGLPLDGVDATLVRLSLIMGAVAAAALVMAAVLGTVILRLTLRPLQRMARTAAEVAALPLDRGEVALPVRVADVDSSPGTEVGQVGAALNHMLSHVAAALASRHASEMRVRRFVADASHELRTPLAAIRGHAELARRQRDALPGEVAHALDRVESESARMTMLVEELLLLARLDGEPEPLREPVDLSRVVADAVTDAHVLGPDHAWHLDLPEEPISVIGDPDQLHRVVVNLLANARVHTPPGTTVSTRLAAGEQGGATLEVSDDGPGITAELLPDLFERFTRGDGSRSRGAGSTGLGLAIVGAVVGAHGGRVDVASRPGSTAFRVTLPANPS
ncbi:MAG TPA: ATP-binding protein [Candidatus Dormibacteraeota bacterium]|jgi:two-component system OmpR family sensor kinase|nr:ATP-binding protein [Candidatus Dormibacteraeota bacterium]